MRSAALLLVFCTAACAAPVFRIPGVPNPTRDKPQSKLWYAHGSWWAWLPVPGGSAIWKRTDAGWRRETRLDAALAGLPGQPDVQADGDTVHAVLVDPQRLAVSGLRWDPALQSYAPARPPAHFAVPGGRLETATIARDGRGRWWIAYASLGRILVRSSPDPAAPEWSGPHDLAELPASKDDICAIAALRGGVGVIWSDQAHDAVFFRRHRDAAPPDAWEPVETVERGNRTADDHFHAALAPDGTLYVASKNSVDTVGKPQLVLRVRDPGGRWKNHPYALRTAEHQPSRPIVLLGGDPPRLFLLHSRYRMDRPVPPQSAIVWQPDDLSAAARTLIDEGIHITDVTGCKARLPAARPWIVLASDKAGNVYEARID